MDRSVHVGIKKALAKDAFPCHTGRAEDKALDLHTARAEDRVR